MISRCLSRLRTTWPSASRSLCSAKADQVCWKCHSDLTQGPVSFACPHCRSLRRLPEDSHSQPDHFTLFGLSRSYNVDTNLLGESLRNLQRQLHPDRYARDPSPENQRLASVWSSRANEAFSTLQKPIQRAEYLLQLLGRPLSETMQMDSQFLAEMMQLNEDAEEAQSEEQVIRLKLQIQLRLQNAGALLDKAFEQPDLDLAQQLVYQMKYLSNVKDQLIQKETELKIVH